MEGAESGVWGFEAAGCRVTALGLKGLRISGVLGIAALRQLWVTVFGFFWGGLCTHTLTPPGTYFLYRALGALVPYIVGTWGVRA